MEKNLIKKYSNKIVISFLSKKVLLDIVIFTIINSLYYSYVNVQPKAGCEGFSCLNSLILIIIIETIIFSFITPIIIAITNNKKIFNNIDINKSTLRKIKNLSTLKLILTYIVTYTSIYIIFFVILGMLLEIRLDTIFVIVMLAMLLVEELFASIGTILCFIVVKFKK